ncbi:MAG: hypothetical protein D6679_00075 [Candidatus Hydrogenedentota bacterium]|nr:MAG: hypothetical protein D6679_00075 [Candidatus Hydrogenedentota bacterium]
MTIPILLAASILPPLFLLRSRPFPVAGTAVLIGFGIVMAAHFLVCRRAGSETERVLGGFTAGFLLKLLGLGFGFLYCRTKGLPPGSFLLSLVGTYLLAFAWTAYRFSVLSWTSEQ